MTEIDWLIKRASRLKMTNWEKANVCFSFEKVASVIPKRAWSGYHLFHLSNMKGGSTPRIIRTPRIRTKVKREEDMDQLITMMKNHTVSDDSPFDFNFTKPLTPQHSPQKKAEFKFSFTMPQHTYYKEQVIEQESQQKDYDERVSNRKILPLPKPRLKKPSNNIPLPANNNTIVFNTSSTITDKTIIDRDNKKKMKCSDSLKTDNKRKERNWKDSFTPNELVHKVPDTSSIGKLLKTKKTEPKVTASMAITATVSTTTTTIINKPTKKKVPKKTKNKTKQKNKEEIAPGGFLSSDINLFENPISDDWICLFCQYDILFNGLSDTRKKNYRKKKERKPLDSEEDA